MNIHRLSFVMLMAGTVLVLLAVSCSKSPAPQSEQHKEAAQPAPSVPNIRVGPAVQKLAEASNAHPKANKKIAADTFGKGQASITVKGHPGGTNHSFWTEELDVDGSGNPVQVDEVWDNRHNVLYLSKDRIFTCGNGQVANGSTLMTVYGKGNTLHKATGSGWWVAELDRGKCAVEQAGIYGCRFDADGNNTECGSAVVHSDEDDVVIIPLPRSSNSVPAGEVSPQNAAPAEERAAPQGTQ